MTYIEFDLLFLTAPLLVALLLLRGRLRNRLFLALAGALTLVALLYMAPWDHLAAVWGLWSWSHTQTFGVRWWNVPPEEYLFCVLEAALAVTLTYGALLWRGRLALTDSAQADMPPLPDAASKQSPRTKLASQKTVAAFAPLPLLALAGGGIASVAALAQSSHWPYLPFLLVWALPVVGLQWLFGGRYLWRERRVWPWIALGLCVYFTLADAVAINAHIWSFDHTALVGFALGPVPIEEVLFYLLTALMVTQGFVTLWFGWMDRHAIRRRVRAALPHRQQ